MMKRIFDIVCSVISLLFFAPLFLAVWLAVILTSGLPGLFRQQRLGRNGVPFTLLKFRTMSVNKAASAGSFEAGSIARITAIGKVLRKTKLDELPQLWNVLKGDMSIVGPRPEVRKWVDVYPERWVKVLSIRPGITDSASIVFRNEEELLAASDNPYETYKNEILPQKLDLYDKYVTNHSFWGDITIILHTILAVVGH